MTDKKKSTKRAKHPGKKKASKKAGKKKRPRSIAPSLIAIVTSIVIGGVAVAALVFETVADVRVWAVSEDVSVTSFEIEYAPKVTYRCFVSSLGGLSCTELAPPAPLVVAPIDAG